MISTPSALKRGVDWEAPALRMSASNRAPASLRELRCGFEDIVVRVSEHQPLV